MTLRYLLVFGLGSLLGITGFVISRADEYRPGMLGILTMLWLSQMAVLTASLIYVLLYEASTAKRQRST
jgi:hypothetical protein